MARGNLRVRVDEIGRLEILDPGFDTLPLLREIDPAFQVRIEKLSNFTVPRFQILREHTTDISMQDADALSVEALWVAHDAAMARLNTAESLPLKGQGVSLLEIKALIAARLLAFCCLCARRCMVDRTCGETGPCGLRTQAFVAEHFVHIAEEAPINPSLVLNLRGCALRCRFCQQHALLDVRAPKSEILGPHLWARLNAEDARSISFVGGNPDESMHAILEIIKADPLNRTLPVAWNIHAYMSEEGLKLLDGVVDCYVPDLKYLDSRCGLQLSGVPHYAEIAKATIRSLLRQNAPVVVRMLVLPGHGACCHMPSLYWLAEQERRGHLYLSVRGQYSPDWKITDRDGLLARRVTLNEVDAVIKIARKLGLQLTPQDSEITDGGYF
jgi:putative pyruvate formate lyase activating enzyme